MHITPSNFAFGFGAPGGYAKFEAFKCALAVESLVKIARYDGDVYIIKEKTKLNYKRLEARVFI